MRGGGKAGDVVSVRVKEVEIDRQAHRPVDEARSFRHARRRQQTSAVERQGQTVQGRAAESFERDLPRRRTIQIPFAALKNLEIELGLLGPSPENPA